MWAKLLFALFCQIGITWSRMLAGRDLGHSINVLNREKFNSHHIGVIRNEDVTNEQWSADTTNAVDRFDSHFNNTRPISRTIDICDNLDKLMEAYFRDIKVEGIPDSSRLFSEEWYQDTIAEKFGISAEYTTDDYSYILVKTSKIQYNLTMDSPLSEIEFNYEVEYDWEFSMTMNEDEYAFDTFINKYGTHFISSFATGGVLYQVFVYKKSSFPDVKSHLSAQLGSPPEMNKMDPTVKKYFSPQYARQVGKILSADGNSTIENWAENISRDNYDTKTYSSLLKLNNNSNALMEFGNLIQNKVFVKLNLSLIIKVIKNESVRDYFLQTFQEKNRNNVPYRDRVFPTMSPQEYSERVKKFMEENAKARKR